MEQESFYRRVKRVLFGAPRDLFDPKIFHNVSLIAFFAWVGLGADGISSSCYGPEEAFLALGSHAVLAIFVAVMSVVTIFIISGSYAQILEAFPSGGGWCWGRRRRSCSSPPRPASSTDRRCSPTWPWTTTRPGASPTSPSGWSGSTAWCSWA